MPVSFDGSLLTPAPFVTYNQSPRRDSRGLIVGFDYDFTLTGTIVNVDSNLDSSGALDATRMQGVLKGQQYIKNLFDTDFGLLEISAPETSTDKISIYCKPGPVVFNNGTWVNRSDYTVSLLGSSASGLFGQLESINESWDVNEGEDGNYVISHNIEAKGLLIVGGSSYNDPLAAAKNWVDSRSYRINNVGILSEATVGSGVMNLANLIYPLNASGGYWNRQATERVDPILYTWGLTENFIYASGGNNYSEDYVVTVNYDIDGLNRANINIAGNVVGFAGNIRDYNTRFKNASGAFAYAVSPNIYSRVQPYVVGYTVNPLPISRQVTYQYVPGIVQYSYSYVAISGVPLVSGAIEETVSINDTGPADIFAAIDVPGRAKGPIIQYMNTRTLPERTVSINATIPLGGVYNIANIRQRYLAKPSTNTLIDAFKPESGYYYITSDSEQWNPIRGEYSRTINWLIDPSGNSSDNISGVPYGPHSVPASG